ncbi:pentapeptide repeat-containing protein [Lentzea sp. NPDC006480]|uniref:pentapeptide repeat-containing protein n=1 Tax=Lentzea sp. NPDC006480 TaxID=3157176 RepID=UPI0033BA24FA
MTTKKPMSPWTMPVVAVAILLLTTAVLVTLWTWVNGQAWTDPEKRTLAQLDVVKVASGIALGGGGLFTLYLAARRQRHQEQAQADTNADAEARRITELYTKAVQQLGEPQAPVRLGGLYALERLGQQHSDMQQTIVDVLCAYLRMPYTPPEDPSVQVEAQQEREVRLTAQRILATHLRPNNMGIYWGQRRIDLTGAVLINFTLNRCRPWAATFDGARFLGETDFRDAEFRWTTSFAGASFEGRTHFQEAAFGYRTEFERASFGQFVSFQQASFFEVSFNEAVFSGSADFGEASFEGPATFRRAAFSSAVWFTGASFAQVPGFDDKSFSDLPMFEGASFSDVRTGSAPPPRPPTPES